MISNNNLDAVIKAMPYIQRIVPIDCMIAVSDREKYVGYLSGKEIKLPGDPTGQPLPEGDGTVQAMRMGKTIDVVIPKEVFGIAFQACTTPVFDDEGEIIGSIGTAIGVSNRETLNYMAERVASASQQTTASAEELSTSAERLAIQQKRLQDEGKEVIEQLNKSGDILQLINTVAVRSNILGLNASIEAARAGEHGRGFSVVADEVRKMAGDSADSVTQVRQILSTIDRQLKEMIAQIDEITEIGEEQVAATEEISAAMQELSSTAEEVQRAAKLVIG